MTEVGPEHEIRNDLCVGHGRSPGVHVCTVDSLQDQLQLVARHPPISTVEYSQIAPQ